MRNSICTDSSFDPIMQLCQKDLAVLISHDIAIFVVAIDPISVLTLQYHT